MVSAAQGNFLQRFGFILSSWFFFSSNSHTVLVSCCHCYYRCQHVICLMQEMTAQAHFVFMIFMSVFNLSFLSPSYTQYFSPFLFADLFFLGGGRVKPTWGSFFCKLRGDEASPALEIDGWLHTSTLDLLAHALITKRGQWLQLAEERTNLPPQRSKSPVATEEEWPKLTQH